MKKSIEPHLENGADYDNAVESEKQWIILTVDTGAESLLFFSRNNSTPVLSDL